MSNSACGDPWAGDSAGGPALRPQTAGGRSSVGYELQVDRLGGTQAVADRLDDRGRPADDVAAGIHAPDRGRAIAIDDRLRGAIHRQRGFGLGEPWLRAAPERDDDLVGLDLELFASRAWDVGVRSRRASPSAMRAQRSARTRPSESPSDRDRAGEEDEMNALALRLVDLARACRKLRASTPIDDR